MTPTDQIDKLEDRVTRLEDRTQTDIVAIHAKLDSLLTIINKALVDGAKNACPSPGACVTLAVDLRNQIVAHNATMLRVERLELRILDMEKWQGRTIGAIAVLITLLTLFAPLIRKLFNLE